VQHDRAAVVERMGGDERRVHPAQALALELELLDRGGRDRHRREAGAVVVDESRQSGRDRRRRAARRVRLLENGHVELGARELHGRHQTVGPGADDEHARHAAGPYPTKGPPIRLGS
jgi:hypothetical protein